MKLNELALEEEHLCIDKSILKSINSWCICTYEKKMITLIRGIYNVLDNRLL